MVENRFSCVQVYNCIVPLGSCFPAIRIGLVWCGPQHVVRLVYLGSRIHQTHQTEGSRCGAYRGARQLLTASYIYRGDIQPYLAMHTHTTTIHSQTFKILRNSQCKDGNVRFTRVNFKPLSNKKCGRYRRFSDLKVSASVSFSIAFYKKQEICKLLLQRTRK